MTYTPWTQKRHSIWKFGIYDSAQREIATVVQAMTPEAPNGEVSGLSGGQISANARLMAAAPEMLEALRALKIQLETATSEVRRSINFNEIDQLLTRIEKIES